MNRDSARELREPSFLDLDPETMRRLGHEMVDRVVEHLTHMEEEPVWRMMTREEGEERLREPVPEAGTPMEDLLGAAERDVTRFAGRIGHPRFFAFVPSAITFPGLMGELLADAHNFFVGTWVGGSGPTMLELVVVDWIRQMLGLPEGTEGSLTSGGSAATITALVAARDARLDNRTEDAVIYASDQTHLSAERAAWIAGFPRGAFRYLPSDDGFRLDPEQFRRAVGEDRDRGRKPFLLVGNAGTTNTGSVDPLPDLAGICREEGLWFHVDAAYGGFAAITERGRAALAGLDAADSWVVDPHKWLYQGYECGSLLVRRPEELRRAFRFTRDYMQDVILGDRMPNLTDSEIQLTRCARAVKVWLSLKYFGLDAFRKAIDRTLDLAARAEEILRDRPEFELLSPAQLGVVCFRYGGTAHTGDLDELNREICNRINQSGYAFLSSTQIRGKYSLRLCILSHRTTEADVEGVIDRLAEIGRSI